MAILYSFRRCPYAIRARYTLALLEQTVVLREVVLKNKPAALLSLGGRSTVPQLIENDIRYEESKDIMFWAIDRAMQASENQSSIASQLWPNNLVLQERIKAWIEENDNEFKGWLDKYKYADRFTENPESFYREKGECFLLKLETQLRKTPFILGKKLTLVDIAIFPFIRQFAGVNPTWFEESDYPNLRKWLANFVESSLFLKVMKKYSPWVEGQEEVGFPPN